MTFAIIAPAIGALVAAVTVLLLDNIDVNKAKKVKDSE
jgi:hypothetical protein